MKQPVNDSKKSWDKINYPNFFLLYLMLICKL